MQHDQHPYPKPVECLSDHAFGIVLLEQSGFLRNYAKRLAGADADDLVQDTLLRCWGARHAFTPGTSVRAWAGTIMRNSFLSARRRTRFHVEEADHDVDHLPSTPENQSKAVELRDVRQALPKLPAEQRDAVIMAGRGMTVEEAADRLAIPSGTYKSRLWRGRRRLTRLIEGCAATFASERRGPATPCEPTASRAASARRKRRDWTNVVIG